MQTNFVRDDELIAAWKIFTPLLHQTEQNPLNFKPSSYKQGTEGPIERDQFLSSMGIDILDSPIPSAL
jgi:glucose-6-phosphate 1-dehydrogenase